MQLDLEVDDHDDARREAIEGGATTNYGEARRALADKDELEELSAAWGIRGVYEGDRGDRCCSNMQIAIDKSTSWTTFYISRVCIRQIVREKCDRRASSWWNSTKKC